MGGLLSDLCLARSVCFAYLPVSGTFAPRTDLDVFEKIVDSFWVNDADRNVLRRTTVQRMQALVYNNEVHQYQRPYQHFEANYGENDPNAASRFAIGCVVV